MATKDARRALYLTRPVDAISSLLFGCCARFHSGEPVDAEYLEELCAAASALPQVAPSHTAWPTTAALTGLGNVVEACTARLRGMPPAEAPAAAPAATAASSSEDREPFRLIRLGAVQTLSALATGSDSAIANMVKAEIPIVAVTNVLNPSNDASVPDQAGLRAACSLLQRLAVRAEVAAPVMAQCEALPALLKVAVAPEQDDDIALAAATAGRLLLEKGVFCATSRSHGSDVASWLALEAAPYVPAVLSLEELLRTQQGQSLQAELARIAAAATPHLCRAIFEEKLEAKWKRNITQGHAEDEIQAQLQQERLALLEDYVFVRRPSAATPLVVQQALTLLGSKRGVEFTAYLLSSASTELHALALAFFLQLRRAHRGIWNPVSHKLSPKSLEEHHDDVLPGTIVEVFGMDSHANMNEAVGSVVSFDSTLRKYRVDLADGRGVFSISGANLYRRGLDGKSRGEAESEANEWAAAVEAARVVEREILALKEEPFRPDSTSERLAKLEVVRGAKLERFLEEDPLFVGALVSGSTPLRERLQQLQGPPGARHPNGGNLRLLLTGQDSVF